MKKFTWIFGLALLWGGLNAVAQQPIYKAADLVTAKTELGKIDGYNKQISDNTSLLNSYQIELKKTKPTVIKEDRTIVPYGTDERTAIYNFWNKLLGTGGNDSDCSLTYKVETTTSGWGGVSTSTLYIYAQDQSVDGASTISTNTITPNGTELSGSGLNAITMYYKYTDKKGNVTYKNAYYGVSPVATTNLTVLQTLRTALQNIPEGDVEVVKESEVPNEDYKTLMDDIAGLKTDNSYYTALLNGGNWDVYSVIKNETDEGTPYKEVSEKSDKTDATQKVAIGCLAYKKLSIENSFNIDDANFTLGDWGTGYTINGKGNVITYTSAAEGKLIETNDGAINNLGVINGKIAEVNNNSIKIAFETTDGTNYDLYDASGTHTEAPMSGELAYNRARPYFGVTINADGTFGTLDKKTAANTVYKAEWTDARTKNTTTFYTNATTTDLSYNPAKGKDNTFAYVLDNDLNVTAAFTAKNVVVKGICKNAEFTDNVTEGDNGYIYIPAAFKAEKLSYNRSFSASALATVCLPFEVSEATFKAAGVTNTMQFYELEAATNTYWFKYQEGSMRANEPYILKFGENFAGGTIFAALENINVAATGSIDRFAVAPERPGSGADFLGVFVSTNATQLAQGGYTLYGFGGGKFRPMTISESNKCLPFRTYVRARNTGNAPAEVFNIGELDEDGNIVTDGGETAISTTEAEAFSVRGINGALVITTDKAQRVSIYTIGGSLVKATNIEAGSVTVPVAAGMYIVNGKKVFVK